MEDQVMKINSIYAWVAIILLLLSGLVHADNAMDETGWIIVRVLERVGIDSQPSPLSNIRVTASGMDSGVTTTDASGEAWFELMPGHYDIRIEADGYQRVDMKSVEVRSSGETQLDDVILQSTKSAGDLYYERLSLTEVTEVLREHVGAYVEIPFVAGDFRAEKALNSDDTEIYDLVDRLTLHQVSIAFTTGADATATVTATATILGTVDTDVLISLIRDANGASHMLLSLRAYDLTVGKLSPALQGTPAGDLWFPEVALTLVLSGNDQPETALTVAANTLSRPAWEFYRQIYGRDDFTLELQAGLNLLAVWPLDNLPPLVLQTLGMEPTEEVVLEGTLGMSMGVLFGGGSVKMTGMYVKATVPLPTRQPAGFPDWLQAVQPVEMTLEVAYINAEMLARVGMIFEAELGGQTKRFVGSTILSLGRASKGILFVAGMEGAWEQPFGVDWLTLEDVGLMLSFSTSGSIQGELFGGFVLGETRRIARIAFGNSSVQFTAQIDRLAPQDLLDLLRQHTGGASLGSDLPVHIVELRHVTLDFTVGRNPSFAVSATALVESNLGGQTRRFNTETAWSLNGNDVEVTFDGSVDGTWAQPFGVSWLTLNDLAFHAAATRQKAETLLYASAQLGNRQIELQIELAGGQGERSARFTGWVDQLSMHEFTALVQQQLNISPLGGSNLDLVLSNVSLSIEVGTRKAFSIAATTHMQGQKADFLFAATTHMKNTQIITGFQLHNWALSDALPALAGSVVDEIRFPRVVLLLARAQGRMASSDLTPEAHQFFRQIYGTDAFNLTLQPGVSLIGTIPVKDNPLGKPLARLGVEADHLFLSGSLPGSLLGAGGDNNVALRAALPPMRPALRDGSAPPWFRSGQLSFFLEAGTDGIAAGLEGALNVTIDDTDMSFIVGGQFGGRPIAISLYGQLATEQPWYEPFDIDWLTIRSLGLVLAFDPVTASLGLGFNGNTDIGSKNLQIDVALALNVVTGVPTNFIFRGASTTSFALADLVALQRKMIARLGTPGVIPIDAIPNIEIRPINAKTPIEVKFALRASDGVQPGFAVRGALYAAMSPGGALEEMALVDSEIALTGISIYGSVPRDMTLGKLTLKDPLIDIDLALIPPSASFVLSGDLILPTFTKHVDIALSRKGNLRDKLAALSLPDFAGLPAGGRAVSGCRIGQTLHDGRCWRILPFAGEELGYHTTKPRCISGLLENDQCWLVPPRATSTRDKVARRSLHCHSRNRLRVCTYRHWHTSYHCPLGTADSGGRCYQRPPGPPRLTSPSSPKQYKVCLGVERGGTCWKLGRAPRVGFPEGGADQEGCPLKTPIFAFKRCWSVPPTK